MFGLPFLFRQRPDAVGKHIPIAFRRRFVTALRPRPDDFFRHCALKPLRFTSKKHRITVNRRPMQASESQS